MRIIKLYIVMPSLRMGGAERVIITLLNYINKDKFDITLIILGSDTGILAKDLPSSVNKIAFNKPSVKKGIASLIRFIRKNPPDILFSGISHLNLALSIFSFLLPKKTKLIVRESNIVSQNVKLFPFSKLFIILYKIFYRRLSLIICQSYEMAEDLTKNFRVKSSNTVILKNPLDLKFIIEKANSRHIARTAEYVFVVCGRLDHQKGFDILLDALSLLPSLNFKLWVIGNGVLRHDLEQRSLMLGLESHVDFLGFQENPFPFIKHADLFILSSRFEGMPNAVLESLALGTPVLATPAPGGVVELLENSNVCLLADDISAMSLAASIQDFLSRKRQKRPEKTIIEPYLAQTITKQFETIIDQNI